MLISFLKNYQRILDAEYEPSKADLLQVKRVTMDITDTIFYIENKILHVVDVMGLKKGRLAWPKYFSQCNCVMFFAALDCYDLAVPEEPEMNAMIDTINLFQNVVDHPSLVDVPIVLFLNKRDLFEKKVKRVPISNFFKDFGGTMC